MKKSLKMRMLVALLVLTGTGAAFGVPPYLWYATHSINYYYGNGCDPRLYLSGSHGEADGFHNAIVAKGIANSWRRYNRRDAECTAARWTGTSAEINEVDFLFYSGLGCGSGPYLGCDAAYLITNWSDMRLGGNGYLKWVQGSACGWFIPHEMDDCSLGKDEFERWDDCFTGVHTVQGHRAATYDLIDGNAMSGEFWNRWVSWGYSIYDAWRDAQIIWVYEVGNSGLQPATAAHDETYAYEYWEDATDNPAPSGMGWLGWTSVGTPEY
jgi:hypothetical protein